MVDANGEVRRAATGKSGFYRFIDVAVGETYILNARAKGYTFPSRFINLTEEPCSIDFTAAGQPEQR